MAEQEWPHIRPSVDEVREVLEGIAEASLGVTKIPLFLSVPSDLLTPTSVYLKLTSGTTAEYSFLLESVTGSTETVGRYSYIGTNPRKVIRTGPGFDGARDPLTALREELAHDRALTVPSLQLPPLPGGAVGYIGYDCVKYFEPRTERPLKDGLQIPEALFMIFDTIVAIDHFFSTLTIVTYMQAPGQASDLQAAYEDSRQKILVTLNTCLRDQTPVPAWQDENLNAEHSWDFTSNVGRKGYEGFVTALKREITLGNIIQAVPSQRFSRRYNLPPFHLYRTLRTLNPSPYLFFMTCSDFSIVGASPECLVKTEGYATLSMDPRFGYSEGDAQFRPRIVNHAIAGTIRRGLTVIEDEELAAQLQASTKDRAEHVMLVDLARNDVNRVCHPATVRVDRLMRVDRFSHVQHLTSEVSGVLRPECSRWDAVRSVFPAGTVSGAPKVRAMELIHELEGERRGIYAGAAGWFSYDQVRVELTPEWQVESAINVEGPMDTCIVIRTMLVKDGAVHMQAGGGIVFDSDEGEEWLETMNKLAANMRCVEMTENRFVGGRPARSVAEIVEIERNKE